MFKAKKLHYGQISLTMAFVLQNLCKVKAEEESIMQLATVPTAENFFSPTGDALVHGSFKSYFTTGSILSPQDLEITLQQQKVVQTVFLLAASQDSTYPGRIGEVEIWMRKNLQTETVGKTGVYDTGIYQMGTPQQTNSIIIRRVIGPNTGLAVAHIRAYQSTNLLQYGATIHYQTPPQNVTNGAENLIQNLESRSSVSAYNARTTSATTSVLASYNSCYITNSNKIWADDNKMKIVIDLQLVYFIHAILIVDDLKDGSALAEGNVSDGRSLLQKLQIYIGNDSENPLNNQLCAGGPFLDITDQANYSLHDSNQNNSDPRKRPWNYGMETWCNLEGRYLFIIADMAHQAQGQAFTQSICSLGVFGGRYVRTQPLITELQIFLRGTTQIPTITTISVPPIYSDPNAPVSNSLEIHLRETSSISFVTINRTSTESVLSIDSSGLTAGTTHELVFESYDNLSAAKSTLKEDRISIQIVDPYPPTFAEEELEIKYLDPEVQSQWTLPSIIQGSHELDTILLVSQTQLSSQLQLDDKTLTLSFIGDKLQAQPLYDQSLYADITLLDIVGQETTYTQQIIFSSKLIEDIVTEVEEEIKDELSENQENQEIVDYNLEDYYISESSDSQESEEETIEEVVITNQKDQDSEESQTEQDDSNPYTSQLIEAVGAIYAELLDQKKKLEQDNLKKQLEFKFKPEEPPRVSQISIDQAGILNINFSKSMKLNESIKTMNQDGMRVTLKDMSRMMQQEEWNIEPVIKINIIPADDTEPESIGIKSWKVKEFTEEQLSIKVEFDDPLSLSVNTIADEIEVKFVSDFDIFFFDENTGNNLNLDSKENLIEKVPKQYPDEDTKLVYDSISTVTGSVSGGLVITNFALNIFLSAALQQLWQLIEAQQLVILLPLTNTNIPPNAMSIFQLLMYIAAFDLLPTDYFYEDVLEVDVEGQPINQNFETGGFEHHLIINNLGSIGIFIATLPFQYIIYYATVSLSNACRCCKVAAKRLKKSFFWGILIRLVIESYTIGFICCLLNAQKIDFSSGNYWITLNSALTILFTIVYSVFPIISARYMYNKFNQLGEAQNQVQYGELYAGYNHKERSMIIYWTVEYLRRVLICLTLVLTQQLFWLQMTTIFYTSTMILIAQNYTRARLSKGDLAMDIFNEVKFIWIMYHVMLFSQTNLVINSETQFMIGHSCAGSLIIGTFVNFYVLVSVAGKQCRKDIRIRLHKRKAKRLLSKKSKKAAKGFQERRLVSQKQEQKRLEQKAELKRMIVIQQQQDALEQQIQDQKDQEQEKREIEQTEQQKKLLQHYLNLREQQMNMQIQEETPNSNSSGSSQDIEQQELYFGSNIEEEKKAPSRINTEYRVRTTQNLRNYREEIVNHEDIVKVSNNANYDHPKLIRAHQNEPSTMQDKGHFQQNSSQQQKSKQAFTDLERDVIQQLQQPLRYQQQEQLVTLAAIGAVENHDDLEEEFDAYLNSFQLVTNNKQNRVAPNEQNEQEQQMNEEQVVKRRPNIVISKDSYWPNE